MQNSTFEVFKKAENRVSGKGGGILFVLKLILGLFPVLQRRGAFLALFACSFLPLYADDEPPTVKNAHEIQIDANTNIALDSTVGGVGGVWPWYSNDVASDPSNSLSVFLASVRNATTHRMHHSASDPGSLSQTSGSTTDQYNYAGIPGPGNDDSAKGVVLQYTAIEERELLIETTGGAYNDSVVVIFTEAHLNGGSAPFKVVTMDSGDATTFKVKFPYFTDNPDGNIYYIALTSYNSSDLGSDTPLRITASADITAPVITVTSGTDTVEQGPSTSTWTDPGATVDGGQTVIALGGTYNPDSFDLIWESLSDPNDKLNMAIEFPAGFIGGPLNIHDVMIPGATLSISSGEITTYYENPRIAFQAYVYLDYSKELIGQEGFEDFNIFNMGGYYGYSFFTVMAPNGARYVLTSMKAKQGVDTSVTGTYTITYTATDAAGNTGTATRTVTVVEAAAPDAPTLTGPSLTNSPTPTLTGTAEADSTVRIYHDGGELGSATADSESGNYSITVSSLLEGSHNITVTATDEAGNVSASTTLTVEVDTTVPDAPMLIGPTLTNSPTPTLTGTAEAGSTVRIYHDGSELGSATAENGSFSIPVSSLSDGSHGITATATDGAGNESGFSPILTVVVDTIAPAAPTLTGLSLTNDPTLTLTGTAEADSTVRIYDGVNLLGSVVVDENGSYSFTVPSLSDGSHGITATATDGAGNESAGSPVITVVVDTTAPDAPTLTGLSLTNSTTLVLTGTAEAGSTVKIYDGVNLLGSAQAENGSYSITVSSLLEGSHNITATATDGAGNLSASATLTVMVDTTAPVITLGGDAVVTLEVGGSYTEESASSDGGETVEATGTVNTSEVGTYTITYAVTDAAGNAATQVTRTVIVEDTTSPLITLTGAAVVTIEVDGTYQELGATLSDNYDTSSSLSSSTSYVINSSDVDTSVLGSYSVTYNVTDSNLNVAQQVTRTVIVEDTTSPLITLNGDAVVTIEVDGTYQELGATVSDNYDTGLSATIDSSAVDTSVVGEYTVTYNVTDDNLNVAQQVTRTVNVVDTTLPVIALIGNAVVTIEVGESYTELGATVSDNYDTGLSATIDSSDVDTSVVGEYTVTYNVTDGNSNVAQQVTRTVNVVDTTKPVISLTGDAVVTIEVGTPYQDQGVTVSDNYDTNLTVTINSSDVDTSVLGSYSVIYSATDSSLNQAVQVTRAVNVVDTTSPVITLNGGGLGGVVTIEVGGTYQELGATLSDNYDTSSSLSSSTSYVINSSDVDTSVLGSYSVTYNVTDSNSNVAQQVTRTVNVVDTTLPVITLNGGGPGGVVTIEVGGTYQELGATLSDNYDTSSSLSSSTSYVINSSDVDTSVVGEYTVTYNVTDSNSNVAQQVTRTVNVVDTTLPVIALIGDAEVTIEVGGTYQELGATVSDNYDTSSSLSSSTSYVINSSDVDTSVVGEYTVTYNVTDSNSNVAQQVTRTVNVVDTTLPVIALIGDAVVAIEVGGTYQELGATVSDNYDTSSSLSSSTSYVINSSDVDTSVVGEYTVTYNVTDSNSNVAQQVTRTVNVVDTTLPVITLNGGGLGGVVAIEVGGTYQELGATLSDNYDTSSSLSSSTSYVINSSDVDTSVVGEYTVTYNVTDSNSNVAQQVTRTVNVVDTTLPVITLNGGGPGGVVTIEVGGTYQELGATLSDNYDTSSSLSSSTSYVINSSDVDTSVLGSYSVTYNVTDSNSNVAQQVTRTVNVVDTTLPVIALNGDAVVTIPLGGSYTEFGATVSDNYDQELAVTIDSSAVDTSVVDSYSVTYNVTDDSNNTGTATRTVNVVDITLPVITLNGGDVTIEAGESYTELGATASDNYYTTGLDVTPTGSVNTSAVGTYTITYSATDGSQNEGTATRTVTVVDTTAPVVTVLAGNDAVVMGSSWTDAGAYADGMENVITTGSVNTSAVGTYTITYSATDGSQNTGTATRTVIVRNSLDSFGDVVVYPNQSTTLIGQVTIEGEAAESGDVVAVYVGDELRGKQEVMIFEGNAWVNVLVNSAGGSETISFKVFDSSTGLTHEKTKSSAVIGQEPFTLGNAENPFMIEMKDFETQTLSLKEGWNLVSFYVEADDMSPETVLAPIQNELLQIRNSGYAYNPNVGSVFNTLTDLNVKEGYWVEVSEDVSFEVEGRVSSGVSTNLNAGWNLVGYPRMNGGEAVASELASLGGTVVQMKSLEYSYDPSNPSFLNTLSTMVPGLGYWLKVSEPGTWVLGDGGPSFANFKTRSNHSSEQKVGPVWSDPVVYPNLGATVLAEVSIQGKPVAMGSVVGVFVGNELRGQQNVVLHEGSSYVTLNVNLNEAEEVSYRVWNRDDNNEYLVSGTMLLELGARYGNPELVELNAVEVVEKPLQVFNVTSEPFGFSFNTMAGRDYTVEATGDLRTWEAVESFQGSGGEIRFTPRPTSSGKRQFFRVYEK